MYHYSSSWKAAVQLVLGFLGLKNEINRPLEAQLPLLIILIHLRLYISLKVEENEPDIDNPTSTFRHIAKAASGALLLMMRAIGESMPAATTNLRTISLG